MMPRKNSLDRTLARFALFAALALGLALPGQAQAQTQAPVFRTPALVAGSSSIKAHLSRSTRGQVGWLSPGKLLLVYADNPATGDVPRNGRIMLAEYTSDSGWSAPIQLNAGSSAGAAQPSLAATGDGRAFVTWQDYRFCSPTKNMMNNIEIFGGWYSEASGWAGATRITATNSGTNGDNGYLPKAALLSDTRVALAWFDFTFPSDSSDPQLGWPSETCLKFSPQGGNFTDPLMNDVIHTVATDRLDGDDGLSFTAPDIAIDGSGNVNLIWATGIETPEGSVMYFGKFNPFQMTWVSKTRLHTGAGGQIDPGHIVMAPNGDIWLAYTDGGTYGNQEVVLQHFNQAGPPDVPVRLTNNPNPQHSPAIAFDSSGKIHCAYIDGTPDANNVCYLQYDPATGTVTNQQTFYNNPAIGEYARVAIAVTPGNDVDMVWENNETLWFTTSQPVPRQAPVTHWEVYE